MQDRANSNGAMQEEEAELGLGGVYKVSLTSKSPLGILTSEGTVTIAPLQHGEYEIKTCLNQTSFPNISFNPLYVRAFARATESVNPSIWNYDCSGELYWKISIFTIRNEDELNVEFHNPPESDNIRFSFKKNAFSLFGYESGTIDNTGTLERISRVISAADAVLVNCPADVLAQKAFSRKPG